MAIIRPKTICRHPGCNRLVDVPGFCPTHQKESSGWYRSSKQTAHQRGYGWHWRRLRTSVLRRDGYLCQVCLASGRYSEASEVDHIIPKAYGGTDDAANLQAICRRCHQAKTAEESKRHR